MVRTHLLADLEGIRLVVRFWGFTSVGIVTEGFWWHGIFMTVLSDQQQNFFELEALK